MKVHTNRFKEEISSFGRQIDSIITYKLNGVTQTITSENLNGVTPTFQGSILKSVMKQLDVDSNIDIPIGTSINYKFGVLVDGKFEYLDFGNYVVFSSEKQEDYDSYKIICYDKMLYSMKQNEDLGVAYPISVRDYLKALCNKLGIQFKNANDNFVNYSRMIKQELYVGLDYTYRDILDELAQVTASTICLNENDELELRYISNNAVDTIDEEYLKDINVNFGQKYGPINSIVLSRSAESDNVYLQDEESVQANGLCELKIVDNQIMNWNDRSDYLPEILNKLDGLEYYINDFASTGIAYLELCDRYNVEIGDNTYSCVMLNDELEVTQGLVENIHTDMPEETETDYTKADKTDRKINNVSLIVDKQQKEINALANKVVDISSTASGVGSVNITNGYKGNLQKLDIYGYMELPIIGNIIIGQFKVNNFKIIVEQNDEVYREYILDDMKNLYQVGTVHDTFEYLDGKCSITKRIGIDDKGNKYVLETPYTIDLKDFIIEVPEGDYKIYTNYEALHLNVEYLTQNQYTDTFATQVDVQSSIKIATDEVLIESKREILDNGDALIASINTKSTGEMLINASKAINFSSTEFNVTTEKTKITIGAGENKKDLINASGVLTNLQFKSSNEVWGIGQSSNYFLGFSPYINDNDGSVPSKKSYLQLDYDIPENFVVQNAYVTIFHTPVNWEKNTSVKTWGYCRNLGVYNVYNSGDFKINAAFFSEGQAIGEFNSTAITNAFGNATYWTARKPSDSSYLSESTTTKDIASSLNASGHGTLLVQSNDTPPYSSTIDGLYTENGAGGKTGSAYAILNIIGYTKV